MNDRRDDHQQGQRDQHHDYHRHGEPRRQDGPPGSEFLDLEPTELIRSEAEAVLQEAARDIMREAIRERLESRMGPTLRRIANEVADQAMTDMEANLKIEAVLDERRADGGRGATTSAAPTSAAPKKNPAPRKTPARKARKKS